MASPAYNKAKGAKFETDIVKSLRELGFDAERLHLNGKDDEGDIVLRDGGIFTVIEAKSGKMLPADFVRQARVETENFRRNRDLDHAKVNGIVVVKRKGVTDILEQYVLTTVGDYFGLRR